MEALRLGNSLMSLGLKHFLLISAIFALLFIPYLSVPLDDDVGAHLMMAKGILEGKRIYTDLFDNKGPFLYLILVPVVLFAGTSLLKLRLAALIFLFAYAFIAYLLMLRAKGEKFALASAAVFYFLALNPLLQAYEFRSELFLGFLIALMILMVLRRSRASDLMIGLALACGIMIKISFVIFLLPCLWYIYSQKGSFAAFAAGLAPAAIVFLAMLALGIFSLDGYVLNVITQPAEFSGGHFLQLPLAQAFLILVDSTALAQLAALAYMAITFRPSDKDSAYHVFYGFLSIGVFAGVFSILVYNALSLIFLPSLAFFLPIMLMSAADPGPKPSAKYFATAALALFAACLLAAVVVSDYASLAKDGAVPELNVKLTLLSQSEESGLLRFIDENTAKNDTISAFPVAPNIYYLSSRDPPSPVLCYPVVRMDYSYYDLAQYFFGPIHAKTPKYVFLERFTLKDGVGDYVAGRINADCPYYSSIGRVEIYKCR